MLFRSSGNVSVGFRISRKECTNDIDPLHRNKTMESLQGLQNACDSPDLTQMVPEDVMTMIDSGRNPDIHTRTFTNRLNSDNQQMRGQAVNFDVSNEIQCSCLITQTLPFPSCLTEIPR